jgi:predicted permease
MLARATAREREIAVRLALGASRTRIARQLLAESCLIAFVGAAMGAMLAQWLSTFFVAFLTTSNNAVFIDLGLDWRVFAFAATLAVVTCLIFGLLPAIRATGTAPGLAMKAGSRGSTDTRERFGVRRTLVIAQVALSLVLLVGALLFGRSLRNLMTLDAGFTQDGLVVASLDFRRAGIPPGRLPDAFEDVIERFRRLPGVVGAAQAFIVPVSGSGMNNTIVLDGKKQSKVVNFNGVSSGYFQTMGTPILAGRDFNAGDTVKSQHVAIVTESFARFFFGGQNPVGRTFQIDEAPGRPRPVYEIVGFARDSKYGDLRDAFEPLVFFPAAQDDDPYPSMKVVLRSNAPLTSTTAAVASATRDVNSAIVLNFTTMQSQVRDSLMRERLMATLSGFFGGLAALIAIIGLYGVMSYSVARRRNEIGIRMALGADRGEVIRMVMREAGLLLVAGLVVGTLAAIAAARSASALLFGLQPHDPATLAMAAGALAAVAALASFLPALRASRLEPTVALREE